MMVKICGLTTLGDTLAAAEAGAAAVGFNFVPSSPRFLAESTLAQWIGALPATVWKVGVFADEPADRVQEISRRLGLDVAQLHGAESPASIPAGLRVWKAVRIRPGFDPSSLSAFDTEAVLVDGPASGVPFDWPLVRSSGRKLILAGGLDETNVRTAIRAIQPWGVDACSRLESSPGRKDRARMTQFIQMALSC